MKILREGQIRAGLYELASLTDVSVSDLKTEFEKTVENISGKNSNAIFLGDDKEQNMQMQTLSLERMFKTYRKQRQWLRFVDKESKANEYVPKDEAIKEDE